MNEQDLVQKKIAEAVTRFESRSMAIEPQNVSVSFSEPYLIVTLRGAISAAERKYAQQRPSRERLEKLYDEVFEAVKAELETIIAGILGRMVHRSRISIDPMVGDAILVFVLGQARAAGTT